MGSARTRLRNSLMMFSPKSLIRGNAKIPSALDRSTDHIVPSIDLTKYILIYGIPGNHVKYASSFKHGFQAEFSNLKNICVMCP